MSRVAIVLAAELALVADVDPRAPGGEVTVALCGSWEHDGPCRWPHNTAIDSDTNPAHVRTVVVMPEAEQDDVVARVERALRADARWTVVAFATEPVGASERALAARLADAVPAVMGARVAAVADVPAVAETLALAFSSDPLWGWAFADPQHRHAQQCALWTLALEGAVDYGWIWTTRSGEAVTLWIPPGCAELPEPHASRLAPLMHEVVPDRADVILEVFDRLDAAHPSHAPHFYLSVLGTHPDHRGNGYGMQLLRSNLALIDEAHMPAYLESTNPANLARYESVGFERFGEVRIPGGGPTVTTMWRAGE